MVSDTMRAVQYDRAGGPDSLEVRILPVPVPTPGTVLVRVHAAGLNPLDVLIRHLRIGRFPRGTGVDYAGEVVAVGSGVEGVRVGQRVWGYLGFGFPKTATVADYLLVTPNKLAPAPEKLDFLQAAALPCAALTALQAVRDILHLRKGQRLLVVGASGGVGSMALQIAHIMGIHVTAVASGQSAELCRELGADHILDYHDLNPAALPREYDGLLDLHGGSVRAYRHAVRPGGRAASTAPKIMPYAMFSTLLPGRRVHFVEVKMRHADLATLAGYADRGQLRPIIDEVYAIDAVRDAYQAVETGHARGKRVIDLTR